MAVLFICIVLLLSVSSTHAQSQTQEACEMVKRREPFLFRENCRYHFQFQCPTNVSLPGSCYKITEKGGRTVLPSHRYKMRNSTPQGKFTVEISPTREDNGPIYCAAIGYKPIQLFFQQEDIPSSTIELLSEDNSELKFSCTSRETNSSAPLNNYMITLLRNKTEVDGTYGYPTTYIDGTVKQEFLISRQSPYDTYIYECQVSTTTTPTCPLSRTSSNRVKANNPQHPKSQIPPKNGQSPTPRAKPRSRTPPQLNSHPNRVPPKSKSNDTNLVIIILVALITVVAVSAVVTGIVWKFRQSQDCCQPRQRSPQQPIQETEQETSEPRQVANPPVQETGHTAIQESSRGKTSLDTCTPSVTHYDSAL